MKKNQINEVRQLQKIAGILKENVYEAGDQTMPDNISLQFIADMGDIDEVQGPAEAVARSLEKAFKRQKYGNIRVSKLAEDFFKVDSDATHAFIVGKSAPSADEIYTTYKSGDDNEAWNLVEKAASSGGEILNEADRQTQWTSQLNQEVNGIEIYNDGDNRLFVIFDKMTGELHVINDWNGEDFDEVWGSDRDIRPDLLAQIQKKKLERR